MLVEQLFQLVSCNLPESMWNHLFNTPNHLTSFLRLFTDSFHIQSNIVTLIAHPKVTQKTENIYTLNTSKRRPEEPPVVPENRPRTPEKEEPVSIIVLNPQVNQVLSPQNSQPVTSTPVSNPLTSIPNPQKVLSPLSPRRKLPVKVTSINDRLKNVRVNNRNEEDKRIEECVEKNEVEEKPKGVSFRLGKYNSKAKEENNERIGNIQNDYNGK